MKKKLALALVALLIFAAGFAVAQQAVTWTPAPDVGVEATDPVLKAVVGTGKPFPDFGGGTSNDAMKYFFIEFTEITGQNPDGSLKTAPWFVRAKDISQFSPSYVAYAPLDTYVTVIEPYTQTKVVKGDPKLIAQAFCIATRTPAPLKIAFDHQ